MPFMLDLCVELTGRWVWFDIVTPGGRACCWLGLLLYWSYNCISSMVLAVPGFGNACAFDKLLVSSAVCDWACPCRAPGGLRDLCRPSWFMIAFAAMLVGLSYAVAYLCPLMSLVICKFFLC